MSDGSWKRKTSMEGEVSTITGMVSGHALAQLNEVARVELLVSRAIELGNKLGLDGYKMKNTRVMVYPKTNNVEIIVNGRRKK